MIPNSVFQFDDFAGFAPGGEWLFLIIMFVVIIIAFLWRHKMGEKKIFNIMKQDTTEEYEEKENISTLEKQQNENALDILKERLDKGEITKKEYDELKKVLGKNIRE